MSSLALASMNQVANSLADISAKGSASTEYAPKMEDVPRGTFKEILAKSKRDTKSPSNTANSGERLEKKTPGKDEDPNIQQEIEASPSKEAIDKSSDPILMEATSHNLPGEYLPLELGDSLLDTSEASIDDLLTIVPSELEEGLPINTDIPVARQSNKLENSSKESTHKTISNGTMFREALSHETISPGMVFAQEEATIPEAEIILPFAAENEASKADLTDYPASPAKNKTGTVEVGLEAAPDTSSDLELDLAGTTESGIYSEAAPKTAPKPSHEAETTETTIDLPEEDKEAEEKTTTMAATILAAPLAISPPKIHVAEVGPQLGLEAELLGKSGKSIYFSELEEEKPTISLPDLEDDALDSSMKSPLSLMLKNEKNYSKNLPVDLAEFDMGFKDPEIVEYLDNGSVQDASKFTATLDAGNFLAQAQTLQFTPKIENPDRIFSADTSLKEQVSLTIHKAIATKSERMQLILQPESLGRIDIHVEIKNNAIKEIKIFAQKEAMEILIHDARILEQTVYEITGDKDVTLSFNMRENGANSGYDQPDAHNPLIHEANQTYQALGTVDDSHHRNIIQDDKVDVRI